MEKLVFVYSWGDEGCCGTTVIPFEFSSKDDFVFYMLEKYKELRDLRTREVYFTDLDIWLNKEEVDGIERNIYTLEEWFKENKCTVKE